MEQTRIAVLALTDTEQVLYSNTVGAVITTMMMYNSNSSATTVTLVLDGVTFLYPLSAGQTQIVTTHIFTNSLQAMGAGVNIHVSGIQMGVND